MKNKKNHMIEIELQPMNIIIKAKLLLGFNKELCQILLKHLPYKSIQCHSFVAGYQLYHYTPIVESVFVIPETAERLIDQPIGRVSLSALQLMPIKYGEVTEPLTANPVAQVVDEDIKKLKRAGKLVWNAVYRTKEVVTVTVRVSGKLDKKIRKIPTPKTGDKRLNILLEKIYKEINHIWLSPPKELVEIHQGIEQPGIGTYNQAFSTMVFVNGELRHLGYNAFGGLLKIASNPKIDLESLQRSIVPFTEVAAGFLGYCGLKKLNSFTQEAISISRRLRKREEFIELFNALTTYTNRLHGWSLQLFPWKYGDYHPVINKK
jgi:hypothetical protein